MKTGIELIAQERKEQIEKHGWTKQHDIDTHEEGELVRAAAAITYHPSDFDYYAIANVVPTPSWAIDIRKKIEYNDIHRLKVAGALIAAEIDRIQSLKKHFGK